MKEAFEKITDALEDRFDDTGNKDMRLAYHHAIKIVHEVAEEYNNGWIPVSERVPDSDRYILVSFENFSVPCVGRYEEDDKGGAFYIGDDDIPLIAQGMIVNAWMPLPEPYKGE